MENTTTKIPSVKFLTVTDHLTDEELKTITLDEVVNKDGFQRIFFNHYKDAEGNPQRLVCVQYITPYEDKNDNEE